MDAPAGSPAGASDAAAPADEQQQYRKSSDGFRGLLGPRAHADFADHDVCLTCESNGRVHRPHTRRGSCRLAGIYTRGQGSRSTAAPMAQRSLEPSVPSISVATQTLGSPSVDLERLTHLFTQMQESLEGLKRVVEDHYDRSEATGACHQEMLMALEERMTELESRVDLHGPEDKHPDGAPSEETPSLGLPTQRVWLGSRCPRVPAATSRGQPRW